VVVEGVRGFNFLGLGCLRFGQLTAGVLVFLCLFLDGGRFAPYVVASLLTKRTGGPPGFLFFCVLRQTGGVGRQVGWNGKADDGLHGGFFGQSRRLHSPERTIMPWSVSDTVRPFFGLMKRLIGQPQGRISLVA
jgi:hypothetical protein